MTNILLFGTFFIILYVSGLLCDLLWSDPDKEVHGWGENDRGVSFTFGAEIVSKFLNRHDLDLICRAHQVSRQIYIGNSLTFVCMKSTLLFWSHVLDGEAGTDMHQHFWHHLKYKKLST